MTSSDYIGLGLSLVLLAVGLTAVLGRAPSLPRHRGWLALLMGAAALLHLVLKSRDVPGEAWLEWAVPIVMAIGLFIAWLGDRRATTDRPPHRAPVRR